MILGAQEIPAWLREIGSSWVETAQCFELGCWGAHAWALLCNPGLGKLLLALRAGRHGRKELWCVIMSFGNGHVGYCQ